MTLTGSREKKTRMRAEDIVCLVTSVGSIATGEMLEKYPLADVIELEIYLVYNTAFMPSLQNFSIWCCSRLKNIPAEKCELESFAISS